MPEGEQGRQPEKMAGKTGEPQTTSAVRTMSKGCRIGGDIILGIGEEDAIRGTVTRSLKCKNNEKTGGCST